MIAEHWVNISQVIMLAMSNDKRYVLPFALSLWNLYIRPKRLLSFNLKKYNDEIIYLTE